MPNKKDFGDMADMFGLSKARELSKPLKVLINGRQELSVPERVEALINDLKNIKEEAGDVAYLLQSHSGSQMSDVETDIDKIIGHLRMTLKSITGN